MRSHVRRLRATHAHIAGAAARAVFEPASVYDADVDEMADEFKSYVDTVAPPFRGTARRVSPDPEDFDTMSEEQKYFFDVSGYLVVRNLLSPEEVATFNTIVDANADRAHDAGPPDDYLTGTPMEGQHGAFVQYTDVLRWPEGQCQPFRELMVHPNLRPVLNTIFGRGWRIETEEVLTMTPGSDGLPFHGHSAGTFDGAAYYAYSNGRMRCGMVVCQFYLTDVGDDDGGLCVVPGSHKANYGMPNNVRLLTSRTAREGIKHIKLNAGDMVMFSESTTHGTLAWKPKDRDRRCIIYRYSPKYLAYGSGTPYHTVTPEPWLDELTPAQRAVFHPAGIGGRPLIDDDGGTSTPRREGI